MDLVTHMRMEVLPEAEILPQSSITAARHIAKYAVEFQILLQVIDSEVRIEPRIVACDQESITVQPSCLMGQHVSQLHISIVGHDEAAGWFLVEGLQ